MPLANQTSGPAFAAASRAESKTPDARPSTMVAKDRPHPAPRPSPDMAAEADRAAFNEAWQREGREAADHTRAARKAAFLAKRQADPTPTRARAFARAAQR